MNVYADRVRQERLHRGWSVRAAAQRGDISNTYWAEFEDYRQPLTPTIAAAVAMAFGWSEDWPDALRPTPLRMADAGTELLEQHSDQMVEMAERLSHLEERVRSLEDGLRDQR